MIFNKQLKATLGVALHDKLNVWYREVSDSKNDNDNGNSLNNNEAKCGIISQITINSSKNCLIFSLFEYNQFLNTDFCVTHAKRKVFEQTNERVNITRCQIINLCRMIPFVDMKRNSLFILHPFVDVRFPLNFAGLLPLFIMFNFYNAMYHVSNLLTNSGHARNHR